MSTAAFCGALSLSFVSVSLACLHWSDSAALGEVYRRRIRTEFPSLPMLIVQTISCLLLEVFALVTRIQFKTSQEDRDGWNPTGFPWKGSFKCEKLNRSLVKFLSSLKLIWRFQEDASSSWLLALPLSSWSPLIANIGQIPWVLTFVFLASRLVWYTEVQECGETKVESQLKEGIWSGSFREVLFVCLVLTLNGKDQVHFFLIHSASEQSCLMVAMAICC